MPAVPGWSADDSGTIVTSVGGTSGGDEVAAARRHVAERLIIEADPVPEEDNCQLCDKRQNLFRGWSSMKHHCCRGIQTRGGPQATDRRDAQTTRLRWCTRRTLQLEMRMVDLRRITSFSRGTSLRTPMIQRSWAATDLFQTRQHETVGHWFFIRDTLTQSMMTRLEQAWSLCSWHCGQVEPLWASSNDVNKKHRELRHGAEHDSIERHSSGLLVWTLGVGMADGPRALTWKAPCALVVAADTESSASQRVTLCIDASSCLAWLFLPTSTRELAFIVCSPHSRLACETAID